MDGFVVTDSFSKPGLPCRFRRVRKNGRSVLAARLNIPLSPSVATSLAVLQNHTTALSAALTLLEAEVATRATGGCYLAFQGVVPEEGRSGAIARQQLDDFFCTLAQDLNLFLDYARTHHIQLAAHWSESDTTMSAETISEKTVLRETDLRCNNTE